MRIVKFIETRHNLLGEGESIRVGTLAHYRRLPEEDGVGDLLEGIAGFETTEDTKLTPETAKNFMPGLKKGVMTVGGGGGIFKGVHNCYIFCTTWFADWDVDETIFPQYNSHYTISNVEEFAGFLASLLQRSLALNDLEDYSLAQLNQIPASAIRIALQIDWGVVEYTQEKLIEISNSNVRQLETFNPNEYVQIFGKPAKYSHQREFRFVFRPFCPGIGFLAVKSTPKNLDLSLKNEAKKWISK